MRKKRNYGCRIPLPGGCSISTPSVHPANWEKASASIISEWYIQYRFYDPLQNPRGKQRIVKGMNCFRTTEERRAATEQLILDELDTLGQGYNPYTKSFTPCEDNVIAEIQEHTPLKSALYIAFQNLDCDKSTKGTIRSVMNYIPRAIEELHYDRMPVGQVRKKHIRRILEACGKIKSRWDEKQKRHIKVTWSADKFNKYRSYLMILFAEMAEVDAIESNPVRDIKKKKTVKRIRQVLTPEEANRVDAYLRYYDYEFWRFLHIFFHSGSRETEIMQVQAKNVNLQKQTYIRLVKKGRTFREVETTIKDIALHLWEEAMGGAKPDDYIFSRDLRHGPVPIRADQIAKRWLRGVKRDLGITVDFYALKHLNTTQLVRIAGDEIAASHNAHTSTAMVVQIYDVERGSREHELIKKVNNPFV